MVKLALIVASTSTAIASTTTAANVQICILECTTITAYLKQSVRQLLLLLYRWSAGGHYTVSTYLVTMVYTIILPPTDSTAQRECSITAAIL